MGKCIALSVLALAGVSFAVSFSISRPSASATLGSPVSVEAAASGSQPTSWEGVASSSGVTVAVHSPTATNLASPVTIAADASSFATITGWYVYVDSVAVYSHGATPSISAPVAMSPGTHKVIVRAWDSTGAFGSAYLTLTVSGVNVAVSSPTVASVASPVTIAAEASSLATITGWYIYVDGVAVYSHGATPSISAPVAMSLGTHKVVVRAWDSTGAFGSAYLTLRVAGVSVGVSSPTVADVASPVSVTADASSLATITGWYIYVDSTAVYSHGASPSISTPVAMSPGTHKVIVRAWDSTGAFGSAYLTLSVAPRHIFVIAEENTSYDAVVGNSSQMPYFNSLLAKGTLWGNYYSNAHGSMLAYIETLSGQTFNCTGNDCGGSGMITGPSLMDTMGAKGLAWKGYFDGLSTCGQLATQSRNWTISPDSNGAQTYYQRHASFPWYAAGTATISSCPGGGNGWWPMSQFAIDLASGSVGQFNWITPDGTNDGHDGTAQQLDAFLGKWLTPLLASSYFQPGGDGIVIVWWDEADLSDGSCGGPGGQNCGGRIPMLVLGPGIRANNVDNTPANHDSSLRFIQEQLGVTPSLGNSINVPDMTQTLSTP